VVAVFGTQTVATLIAVFGVFMTPLGWGWALFVWGYALAWFLVNDQVKVLAYRILDPAGAKAKADAAAEPEAKPDAEPEPDAKPKADAKPEPDAKPKAKPDAKPEPDAKPKAEPAPTVTPRLVERVHDLYEELGREDVRAVQDWEKAQSEDREDKPDA
jgi:H+-transporting ATPase